jgi:hypothetical protein
MASANRQRGGRIRSHERETNDNAVILGADLVVQEEHLTSFRNTENQDIALSVKRNYRNRLMHIYKFWKKEYPQYYAIGVRELTEEDLQSEDVFYHKCKHDLVYVGLNVQMVKTLLAHKKVKQNGKASSHVQLRKYNDAIIYGSKCTRNPLPRSYYDEMENYLNAFKKETTQAKKDGMLDEQEADPISWSLFRTMLGWALKEMNIFLWVFSILQWNCMARSINIGVLAFHNFGPGKIILYASMIRARLTRLG